MIISSQIQTSYLLLGVTYYLNAPSRDPPYIAKKRKNKKSNIKKKNLIRRTLGQVWIVFDYFFILSLRSFCNEDILHWLEIGNLLEFIVEAEERDLNFNLPDPNPPPPNVDPETGLIIA
eukprot:Pgem_evm1s15424